MPELPNKFVFCPNCGKQLDGTTFIKRGDVMPRPGDLSICFYCGTILEFEEGFFVHEFTKDMIDSLKITNPRQYDLLIETKTLLLKIKRI